VSKKLLRDSSTITFLSLETIDTQSVEASFPSFPFTNILRMTSTGHTGSFSDDSAKQHTVVVPADRTATSSSSNPSSSSTDPAKDDGKPWKPVFNRQQSWSKQDMKRQLQDRLLQPEKGKESGYTEKP
jgi:hypothetical protein